MPPEPGQIQGRDLSAPRLPWGGIRRILVHHAAHGRHGRRDGAQGASSRAMEFPCSLSEGWPAALGMEQFRVQEAQSRASRQAGTSWDRTKQPHGKSFSTAGMSPGAWSHCKGCKGHQRQQSHGRGAWGWRWMAEAVPWAAGWHQRQGRSQAVPLWADHQNIGGFVIGWK